MRNRSARLSDIWCCMFFTPCLTFLVLAGALFPLSTVSQAQSPSEPQHSSIQKLAFEAGGYLNAGVGGASSKVEGVANGVLGPIRSNIYVRDPLESQPRWVAEGEYPTWSPDGSRLAYCTMDEGNYGQIRIVNATGKGGRQLTHLKSGACYPEWSPDGKEIAITLIKGFSSSVAIINEDGTLLRDLGPGRMAHWSPDGKWLVIMRPLSSSQQFGSIWIMRADGSDAREILRDGSHGVQANWLPDGKGILFTSQRDGLSAAFTVDLDGKNVRKLGADPVTEWFQPVLSPDGRSLIVEAVNNASTTRVSVLQIDASTRSARMLAYGVHFSVLWGK
jgi:Tol biopolymer transport system component